MSKLKCLLQQSKCKQKVRLHTCSTEMQDQQLAYNSTNDNQILVAHKKYLTQAF